MENKILEGEIEIEVKRFYLPLEVNVNCPHCDFLNNVDFVNDYISYPLVNSKDAVYRECEKCDNEFYFNIILRMNVDIDLTTHKD